MEQGLEQHGTAKIAPHKADERPVQIWIRHKGVRRQAFYRRPSLAGWSALPVPRADQAIRTGLLTIDGLVDAPVVSRETQESEHPMAKEFAAQAVAINQQIDALVSAAGVTA